MTTTHTPHQITFLRRLANARFAPDPQGAHVRINGCGFNAYMLLGGNPERREERLRGILADLERRFHAGEVWRKTARDLRISVFTLRKLLTAIGLHRVKGWCEPSRRAKQRPKRAPMQSVAVPAYEAVLTFGEGRVAALHFAARYGVRTGVGAVWMLPFDPDPATAVVKALDEFKLRFLAGESLESLGRWVGMERTNIYRLAKLMGLERKIPRRKGKRRTPAWAVVR